MANFEETPRFEGAQLVTGESEQAQTCDARFLIATLLVFVAKGDGSISSLESDKMIELLSSKLNETGPEALEHLSAAIMALANDTEIVQTLQNISEQLSVAEKREVFTMLLDVMTVDQKLDPGELEAINFAGQVLGFSQDAIHTGLRQYQRK